jgi:ABC-2 type transport system permease protein
MQSQIARASFNFRTIWVLWLREMVRMFKEPSRILGVVVQPLMFWFVIGSGFMPTFRLEENQALDYQTFFFPGVLALVILFTAIFATITLIDDRSSGFLQAVLVGPGSRTALVLGKILGVVTIAFVQAGLFMAVAPFVGIDLGQLDLALLIAFIFLGAMAMSGIGFVFAWGTQSSAAYHALMSVILIPMWILSGAMFPAKEGWMKSVMLVNPMGWLVAGLRGAFAGRVAPLGSVPLELSVEFSLLLLTLFCIFIIGIGVWVCNWRR